MIKLLLQIDPEKPSSRHHEDGEGSFGESLMDKLERTCRLIEGPEESSREWDYLKTLYRCLKGCHNRTMAAEAAMRLIEPTIIKGMQDDPDGGSLVDGDSLVSRKGS